MTTRVALFLPSLNSGGAQRVMLNLLRFLLDRKVRTDLVVANIHGPYRSQIPSGARVVHLKGNSVVRGIPSLVGYLRNERPTALLSALPHANIAALLARRIANCSTRILVSEHNSLTVALRHKALKKPQDRLKPVLIRWCYPSADMIVAVSQGVAQDLKLFLGLPDSRIKVIYNPIVTPEITKNASQPVSHPWLIQPDSPVILGVGRLTRQKDFPTLLRAFAQVRSLVPAKLIILGEGPGRDALRALAYSLGINDDLDMPGFVQNPYAFMRRASVVALSSAWEGFGNILVEAMAVGTPVVSTDCPNGPREILCDGVYGPLVPVGDANALAQATLRALRDPADPALLRRRSETFAAYRVAEEYLKLLLDD